MSRGVRLSVLGLYHWDSGLFDLMQYPEGFTDDQKQTVVGNILGECAELESLFTDWGILRNMIGLWSKMELPTWQRIYIASKLEYNPIENYNRTELETIDNDRSETHSGKDSRKLSGSDSMTLGETHTETHSGKDSSNTTNKIAAYENSTMYTHDTSDSSLTHGESVTRTATGSDSTTYGKQDDFTHGEKIVNDDYITRNNHTTGNIGVTTSQQMLQQEIDIAAALNVIPIITRSFKERFCLLVY